MGRAWSQAPPYPRGATDLEDPSGNWSGEATPGWTLPGFSWHPFWVPKARQGSPRVEDPLAHLLSHLAPEAPRLTHPPACPLHLPMNSISLSSLKTTEL